ncbi:MAG: hypothetical protein QXR03_01650 [Candidatus Aenigmatarchaeota archaeon]
MKKERINYQKDVRDLLIILLLACGIEAKTIAKVLGVVPSAITNRFPVTEIQSQSKLIK